MAHRDRSPAPPAPPEAPLAAELLASPGAFFGRLGSSEPKAWRYVAPVFFTALLAGVLYALLMRPVAGLGGGGTAAHLTNVFGNFFITVFGYGLMSGLGFLGAGRAGRAAEVYGATFALLPPLYLLLAALLLVLPGPGVPAPTPGADLLAAQRSALRAVAAAPLARVTVFAMLLGTLAQFFLAYRGFRALTGSRWSAALGTLSPLVPVLLLTALGVAPLIAAIFAPR